MSIAFLADFLLDICLRDEIDSHWCRITLNDLKSLLEDRINFLKGMAISNPGLNLRVGQEIKKNDVVTLHLNRYEEVMTSRLQNGDDNDLFFEGKKEMDTINLLILLMKPRPAFRPSLDKSNHLENCETCKQNFLEDQEAYNDLSEDIDEESFDASYALILNAVSIQNKEPGPER